MKISRFAICVLSIAVAAMFAGDAFAQRGGGGMFEAGL